MRGWNVRDLEARRHASRHRRKSSDVVVSSFKVRSSLENGLAVSASRKGE